jgi:hypothetical protein
MKLLQNFTFIISSILATVICAEQSDLLPPAQASIEPSTTAESDKSDVQKPVKQTIKKKKNSSPRRPPSGTAPKCCTGVDPRVPRGCVPPDGWYFMGDFLYWRAENHGFSFALNNEDSSILNGKIERITPEWDPGFRLGLGWNTEYDVWDLLVNWTWYNHHSHSSKSRLDLIKISGQTQGFYPMNPVAVTSTVIGPFASAVAHYHLIHNAIDLEIGRSYYVTKELSFRPHWGVRGAWLNQKFSDRFFDAANQPDEANFLAEQRFSARNHYWGIGPRVGSHGEWHLNYGFSVIGKAAGALLYGGSHVKADESRRVSDDGNLNPTLVRRVREHFDQLVPNLQMMIGMQWGSCFNCDKNYFNFNLCWETNYWWNMYNVPTLIQFVGINAPFPTIGNQPVTMEGLTINAQFDF